MAINTYVVRLIDCLTTAGGVGSGTVDVQTSLSTWYRAVCQQASSAGTTWNADVQWLANPPSSNPGQDAGSPLTINMIVFFIPGPSQGVIRLHQLYRGKPLPADTDTAVWGTTVSVWNPPGARIGARNPVLGISEVYISRCRGGSDAETRATLARMAFHESMHNQLIRPEADLHRGNSGFAADVPAGAAPSGANIQMMAVGIGTLVPQWLEGFQAWRTNAVDPLGI
jgi:hypothetical protein